MQGVPSIHIWQEIYHRKRSRATEADISEINTECTAQNTMTLQKYEFELLYIPRKQSIIADALLRPCISDSTQKIKDSEMKKYIHTIQTNKYPMSDHKLNVYRSETAKDPTLQMLIKYRTYRTYTPII